MATEEVTSQLPLFENRRPETFHLTMSCGVKLDLEDGVQLALAHALKLGRPVAVTVAPVGKPEEAVVFDARVTKRAFTDKDIPSTNSHVAVLRVSSPEE
jgi:hypothetical protein